MIRVLGRRFAINLLRRLLGRDRPEARDDETQLNVAPLADGSAGASDPLALVEAVEGPGADPEPDVPAPDPIPCPYCGFQIERPPTRTRRCPSCRQPVIVRRVDGVFVYLTESSAAVLTAERGREADVRSWDSARHYWLGLAVSVQAPVDLCAKVAAMPLSDRSVEAARAVYRTAADQAVREARESGQWVQVSRIRTAEADALYRDAGSPLPPPADLVAVYREARAAVLHSLAAHSPVVELAGDTCCRACRAEEGALFTIAVELRKPRLPHEGCPRGLCGCDWFVALPEAKPARRRRRKSTVAVTAGSSEAAGDEADEPAAKAAARDVPEAVEPEAVEPSVPDAADSTEPSEPEAVEPEAVEPSVPDAADSTEPSEPEAVEPERGRRRR